MRSGQAGEIVGDHMLKVLKVEYVFKVVAFEAELARTSAVTRILDTF